MGQDKKRVLVGMSGGVDSSVTVLLLKEQGYDCVGATMELMGSSPENIEDARQTAGRLGIPHHVLGFADAFEEKVVRRFVEAYERGETPNPCVDCNRFLKFGLLYQKARELGCDLIATGHYAQVLEDGAGGLPQRAQGRQPGYLFYSGRGLSLLYGAVLRENLSGGGHSGPGGQGGGPPSGCGGAHHRPAQGGGGVVVRAHLRVRQVRGGQYRHCGTGGGALFQRLHGEGLELAYCPAGWAV